MPISSTLSVGLRDRAARSCRPRRTAARWSARRRSAAPCRSRRSSADVERHELVPRRVAHRLDHARVLHAGGDDLLVDHPVARGGEVGRARRPRGESPTISGRPPAGSARRHDAHVECRMVARDQRPSSGHRSAGVALRTRLPIAARAARRSIVSRYGPQQVVTHQHVDQVEPLQLARACVSRIGPVAERRDCPAPLYPASGSGCLNLKTSADVGPLKARQIALRPARRNERAGCDCPYRPAPGPSPPLASSAVRQAGLREGPQRNLPARPLRPPVDAARGRPVRPSTRRAG